MTAARWVLLALLTPLALRAQEVVLVSVNPANVVESSIPAAGYNYGAVAAGDTVEVRFHARNLSAGQITITNITVSGPNAINFNETAHTSSTPYVVPPGGGSGSVMAIFVDFSGMAISSYSATLQVTYADASSTTTTVSANLLATVVPAPTVSVGPPCTGPDSNKNINFGRILQATQVTCTLYVQNPPNTAALPVILSGTGFTASFGSSMTVGPGLSATASLTFTAAAASSFSGTLTVGTRTYALSGVGYSQPLPTPVWTFDSSTFRSGEQHTLSIGFATPSPVTASGFVTLTFAPAVSAVSDDVAVVFVATSQRVVSFTVNKGDSALTLNRQPNIIFGTGTTAGKITFTVNAGAYGITGQATTTLTVAPAAISITQASAISRANDLDVVVTGFDNTYTAGPMSFTFYDRNGNPMGSAITADFSSNFSAFYQGQSGGSAFLMRVSFPVTGNVTTVGAVQATLNNAAGPVRTGNLGFP
jgi:hypothetical protein